MFLSYGYNREESEFIAEVITTADLFGIESHGVNRLTLYPHGIDIGRIKTSAAVETVYQTPVSAVSGRARRRRTSGVQTGDGAGNIYGKEAWDRNGNRKKFESFRNSRLLFQNGPSGRDDGDLYDKYRGADCSYEREQPMLGTNPIAVSIPAEPIPYNLDMSTSVVPGGKLEVYAKNQKPLPNEWIVDPDGVESNDPNVFLKIRNEKTQGGILPLGGIGELHGGHKGYSLGLLVELMTGNFAGGVNSDGVRKVKNREKMLSLFWRRRSCHVRR